MKPFLTLLCASAWLVVTACSGGPAAPPPPPPQGTAPTTATAPTTPPPGQVMIVIAASSTPQGAVVSGGGQMLGRTPFTTQVPIPAPQPGETQAFQFTFVLPGYEPVTLTASPVNQTITLNATMRPVGAPDPTAGGGTPDPTAGGGGGGGGGGRFTVRGPAGGRIYDNHTTTSTARATQDCNIASLSIDIDGNHTYFSDLVLTLQGPDGTRYPLQSHERRNPFRRYTIGRARGHRSGGAWTVAIADTVGADSGNFTGWSMTVQCQ